ncbi:hypothetical protein SPRG_02587 [Saprolegnia parasitica CBS 223.65]|uniref:Uncharacterized protein n=1 Tax=Saprolegnia parasitica (strain CBS 223.65) TaxID=695850 RepID=A0A067D2B7_SAPPC|nr:hypothetical protein SPRG_02587 [Saprolegnia parasitica CBS 223.65]KDO32896.1 hypothetical protein SPRG_02587 [Saprolegnia parasitica CBS 223.65]|eukprot:XP_012196546.1 hypothetical protein SPRG_02587 [Saprolegnia parasitica CBS 223.65]
MADRLSAIKSKIAQRSVEHRQRNAAPDPPVPFRDVSLEQMMEARLHALQREIETKQPKATPRALPRLPDADFTALVERTTALSQFHDAKATLDASLHVVHSKVQRADDVAENLRDQVEALYQLTPELDFDARALRWRSIVATRTESRLLRADADAALHAFAHTELRNPYSHLTTLTDDDTPSTSLPPATRDVWLIGRRGIEVNSDTVVYYGAYLPSPSDAGDNDARPLDGLRWLACSAIAAEPSPTVSFRKGTVEAWDVVGAGVEKVNGIYVLSGRFEHANKYTSVAGLELFRKR